MSDAIEDLKKKIKVGDYVRHPKGKGRVVSVHHNQTFYGISHPSGIVYLPGNTVQNDPDHDGDNDMPGGTDPDHDPVMPAVQQVGDVFHVKDVRTGESVAVLGNRQAAVTVHDAMVAAGQLPGD